MKGNQSTVKKERLLKFNKMNPLAFQEKIPFGIHARLLQGQVLENSPMNQTARIEQISFFHCLNNWH